MKQGIVLTTSLLFFFTLCVVVSAAPPQNTVQSSTEWTIVYPHFEQFKVGYPTELHFHIYNSSGDWVNVSNSSCEFHLYNKTNHVQKSVPFSDGLDYEVPINGSVLNTTGRYSYIFYCHNSTLGTGGYIANFFDITDRGAAPIANDGFSAAIVILLPLLITIILLAGAWSMDSEEHGAFKTALFLASFLPFFASTYFASIVISYFYDMPELITAIGDTTRWFGLFFFAVTFYIVIYTFYKLVTIAAQKKQERLRY